MFLIRRIIYHIKDRNIISLATYKILIKGYKIHTFFNSPIHGVLFP